MSESSQIVQFLGRLHPLLLHLPIGFLALAFLLEIFARFRSFKHLKASIPFILVCGMLSAIITAIFGYLLSLENGYTADNLLTNHKWAGIATAILSIVLYFFRKRERIYQGSFLLLIGLLMYTGHSGGSITHGEDFLFEPFQEEELDQTVFVEDVSQIEVFNQVIRPIFKSKCNSCHNSGKAKGGLIMTDTISILKGGESGKLFTSSLASSLLIQRIKLDLEEKKHMPPKGKRQLNDEEIKLLEWWVSGTASFHKKVSDFPEDEAIKEILKNKFSNKTKGIKPKAPASVSPGKLAKLQQQGVKINALGDDSPWLEARLSNQKTLSKSDFKNLKKVADNISILDLGNTPMDDALSTQLNSFPHLSKLFLDQTSITDKGFRKIEPMKYLEYLNIYDCNLSDEIIPHLEKFKNLQALYLWKTKISASTIAKLRAKYPNLKIIDGNEHQNTFASAQLRAPKILADSTLFSDSLMVDIQLNFPWAKIYYSLDGSTPDTSSQIFSKALTINHSTTIKAIAMANNWEPSDISEATFLSIRKRPVDIRIDQKPSDQYKGKGVRTLADFTTGSSDFKDGKWLGWQGKSPTVFMDMGAIKEISRIFVSCLDNNGSWIFFPRQISVWHSEDGQKYSKLVSQEYPLSEELQAASNKMFEVQFPATQARFLKVRVDNVGKNPNWHPAPGKPSWLFMDEIIVD